MLTRNPQRLNLDSYDVFHECDPYKPTFFDVQGILNETFGYGKHGFAISIIEDPDNDMIYFKNGSQIKFEVLDTENELIYSGLTNVIHVNGSSFGYFFIQEDLINTYKEISNGPAKIILLGQVEGPGVPSQWKNTYNIKTEIPFFIRKQHQNTSFVLFEKETPNVVVNGSDRLYPEASDLLDPMLATKSQTYHTHEFDNLHTFSGQPQFVEISYALSASYIISPQTQILDTFEISSDIELLTNSITKSAGNLHIGDFTTGTRVVRGTTTNTNQALHYWYTGSLLTSLPSSLRTVSNSKLNMNNVQGIHALVRKTVTDEQFKLRITPSGSGRYAILSAPTSESITNPGNSYFLKNTGFSTENISSDLPYDVLVYKEFNNYAPENRIAPTIDGELDTTQTGTYNEHTFIVPSGSWIGVRLMSNAGTSASFSDISVKQSPPAGVSPTTTYYSTRTPDFDYSKDEIIYNYRFYNTEKEIVQKYDTFPVSDIVLSSSLIVTNGPRILNRRELSYGHRLRLTQDTLNRGTGLIVEAAGAPQSVSSASFISPTNSIIGLYAQAAAVSGTLPGVYGTGIFGLQAAGLCQNNAGSESVYSAKFQGSDGCGDVIIEQKLGIGSFNTSNQEHPVSSLHVKGDITSTGNLTLDGDITANRFVTSESILYASSGSNSFGNTADDEHRFTGSLHISGNKGGLNYNHAIYIDQGNLQFTKPTWDQYIIFEPEGPVTYAKNWFGVNATETMVFGSKNNMTFQIDQSDARHYFGNPVTVGTVNTNNDPGNTVELHVLGKISGSSDLKIGGTAEAQLIKSYGPISGTDDVKVSGIISASGTGVHNLRGSTILGDPAQGVMVTNPSSEGITFRGATNTDSVLSIDPTSVAVHKSFSLTGGTNMSSSGQITAPKLIITKQTATSNEKLISLTGAAGSEKFSVDEDGDLVANSATIGGSSVVTDSTLGAYYQGDGGPLKLGKIPYVSHEGDKYFSDSNIEQVDPGYSSKGIYVTGSITSSAAISASGHIDALSSAFNSMMVGSTGIAFSTNFLSNTMKYDSSKLALVLGGNTSVSGHITASGDISSSATGIFNKLEIHGADGTLAADYIIHKDDSNTKFGFPQNDKFKIQTAGTNRYVVDTTHEFTGDITADSNISSSATSTGSFGHLMVGGGNFSSASLAAGGGGGGGTITSLNNQAENRLVTIGSTTTELDGEANLKFFSDTLEFGTNTDTTIKIKNATGGAVHGATLTIEAADGRIDSTPVARDGGDIQLNPGSRTGAGTDGMVKVAGDISSSGDFYSGTNKLVKSSQTGSFVVNSQTSSFASGSDVAGILSQTGSYLTSVDISSNTNLAAGTNITLTGDTLNVDDAFLINSGDDTTSGVVTAGGFKTAGVITGSNSIVVGDLSSGTYISGSQGNLELSGSGIANIIVSGTVELENRADAPSTTTNKLYNSGSVSASVNTPTLHFNDSPVGYVIQTQFRVQSQTNTDRGYFAPYWHGTGYYSWRYNYYLQSYNDDEDITIYRDIRDGQGSVLYTMGYTSGYTIPATGLLKRIVGSTMNYSADAAYNINFYHGTPNYSAASVTSKRVAQFVSDTSGDNDTSEQILIDNINKPVSIGDVIHPVIRKTEAGSGGTYQYIVFNLTMFFTTS